MGHLLYTELGIHQEPGFVTLAHPFWYPTDCVLGNQTKGCEFCYFTLKFKDLKSYDMQSIYAIM
jgi:hypothetical protein